MSKEAMKLALEALEKADAVIYSEYCGTACEELQICEPAIKALEEALAKQEQDEPDDLMIAYMSGLHDGKKLAKKEQGEPVAEKVYDPEDDTAYIQYFIPHDLIPVGTKFYTTPQQRKPLTEWQPIETAPTKGRELILLLTPSKWPQVAYTNTWWTSGFSVENKPTHWMPIPPIEAAHGIKE